MEIKVIEDKILVKLDDKKEESGFVVSNKVLDNQLTGTVLSVGNGNSSTFMQVEVGNKVVFHKNGCYRLEIDNEEYFVLTQQQVLAIISE